MGGSSYSDDFYKDRAADRAAKGVGTFDYSYKVSTGAVAKKVHDNLNINGKIRESRDSAAHPESVAIGLVFDVTGSMGGTPVVFQKKIPTLMGLILKNKYLEHPQLCVGAVGDFFSDKVSLQIGQFESGVEMDDDINNIYLEGGGGGSFEESYQNAMYYFGHRTSIDCWEKRGKKGYLFLVGDEKCYPSITKRELTTLVGVEAERDIPIEEIVSKVKEKYEVYFIIPQQGTSHGHDPVLKKFWSNLLGDQNVLMLSQNDALCELVATTIGVFEGVIDADGVKRDLATVGSSVYTDAVTTALAPVLSNSGLVAKTGGGSLSTTKGKSGTVRL